MREQDNKRKNKDSNFVHFGENSSSLVRAVIAASIFENIIIPSSRFNINHFINEIPQNLKLFIYQKSVLLKNISSVYYFGNIVHKCTLLACCSKKIIISKEVI